MSIPPPLIDVPELLRTPRLVIRPYRDEDADALWASVDGSRAFLGEWLPWVHEYRSIHDARLTIARFRASWAVHDDLPYGVFEREHGDHVGGVGLHNIDWEVPTFEVGYWLRDEVEGRGLMTECAAAVTRMAFQQLGARRVEIRMDTRNERSRAIPERLGFRHEGTYRNIGVDQAGKPFDRHVFALVDSDDLPASNGSLTAAGGNDD